MNLACKKEISPFGEFVIRTPAFKCIGSFKNALSLSSFWEALYIASPSLYSACEQKQFTYENLNSKELRSLYKYYLRSTCRATPFGLFAGCSVGSISEKTSFSYYEIDRYKRITRLDMELMCAIIEKIKKIASIRKKLLYHPNTSLYCINKEIRYIECVNRNGQRIHNLVRVERNAYLDIILQTARSGQNYTKIAHSIVDVEISEEDSIEFIESLIDSQILCSNIDIHVTGDDPLNYLITQLQSIDSESDIITPLRKIELLLKQIDQSLIGTSIPIYAEIRSEIDKLEIKYKDNCIYQSDLFIPTAESTISSKLVDELIGLMNFTLRLTPLNHATDSLSNFKRRFQERYDQRTVSLIEALDVDSGIGYKMSDPNVDLNILIKDIVFPKSDIKERSTDVLAYCYAMLSRKNWLSTDKITLSEYPLHNPMRPLSQFPFSFLVSISIVTDESNSELALLNGIWFGATNAFGRFCHIDEKINKIVKKIAKWEQNSYSNAILASISHLPESRLGNVLIRPNTIREYEIPYLVNSHVENSHKLLASDLLIALRENELVITSRKFKKEVIPKLDNSHNYSVNSLPVYNFLCDMQKIPQNNFWQFIESTYSSSYDYLPRIVFGNFILKKAHWRIDYSTIADKNIADCNSFTDYRVERNIPRYISHSNGDNVLHFDSLQELSVKILIDTVKKNKSIVVEESFFAKEICNSNSCANEILIPFKYE